jgi:pyrimidine-nucleoside phosphorylase
METVDEARELAQHMVAIGRLSGREVVALLSDMNQPLGEAVGNALEVREAIEALHNRGPADFREHCLVVASHMLLLGKKAGHLAEARALAEAALADGRAWEKFRTLVESQGGDLDYVDHPEKLPSAPVIETVPAPQSGWLKAINAREVGETSVSLGAGRERKGDAIDHGVGMIMHHKVGDRVEQGQPLFTVYAKDREDAQHAAERLVKAHEWSQQPCPALPLFYDFIQS